jgi:hypothetical protein
VTPASSPIDVIPGFMPGIHLASHSEACGWLDPGDKPRDDNLTERVR